MNSNAQAFLLNGTHNMTQIVDALQDLEPDYLWQMIIVQDLMKGADLTVKAEYNENYVRYWELSSVFGNTTAAFIGRIPVG